MPYVRVFSLLLITLPCCTFGQDASEGVRVVKLTPPEGGSVLFKNSEWTFIVGSYWGTTEAGDFFERAWVWTAETGTFWLDQVTGINAEDARVREIKDLGDDYLIEIRTLLKRDDGRFWYKDDTYFVWLPKDVRTWFAAGDLDRDRDVDQTDFGLFQRCLSGPGVPASESCHLADLDTDGDVDVDDTRLMTAAMMGVR